MVKGVHKKIIEVRSPGGDYFEKAVFYLRPGVTQLPPELTEAAAQMLLEEIQPRAGKSLWKRIALILGSVLLAAVICVCAYILA
ncbi:MAG: hypothetical protein PUA84_05090 [Oscillospiraceae bacterium]|nr:hypothetical protein [Oscillospiraceae bacterium]